MAHRWRTAAEVNAEESQRRSLRARVQHHPGQGQYLLIAFILAIITAVEVVLYYVDLADGVLFTALVMLSVLKFVMVAGWFMHLKFDSSAFTVFFAGGLVLALAAFIVVLSAQRAIFT